MDNSYLLIDGENLKYKLEEALKSEGKTIHHSVLLKIDFNKLFNNALNGINIDKKTFYCAKINECKETLSKSKELIKNQRTLKTNLEKLGYSFVVAGNVRAQIIEKNMIGQTKVIFKEKGVDVKIAVDLVTTACDKKAKTAILCSSDSDLQPAIKEARSRGLEIIYLGFETAPNKGLTYTTNKTILFRNKEILEAYNSKLLT